jgi:hypothetical protein
MLPSPQGRGQQASQHSMGPSRQAHRHSTGFSQRMDSHLTRKGYTNATSASRIAQPVPGDGVSDSDDELDPEGMSGGVSVGGRSAASYAPSLHPSVASTFSAACSESTIGAGDDTGYWDYRHREVAIKDLGHKCRECKLPFRKMGEPMTERRGARTSMRYHAECFSGFADPRSQNSSSMHVGKLAGTQMGAAPTKKAGSKMRTGQHFEGGLSDKLSEGGGGGKIAAAFLGGSSGFGADSAKKSGGVMVVPARPGLSISQLEEHNKNIQQQEHQQQNEIFFVEDEKEEK